MISCSMTFISPHPCILGATVPSFFCCADKEENRSFFTFECSRVFIQWQVTCFPRVVASLVLLTCQVIGEYRSDGQWVSGSWKSPQGSSELSTLAQQLQIDHCSSKQFVWFWEYHRQSQSQGPLLHLYVEQEQQMENFPSVYSAGWIQSKEQRQSSLGMYWVLFLSFLFGIPLPELVGNRDPPKDHLSKLPNKLPRPLTGSICISSLTLVSGDHRAASFTEVPHTILLSTTFCQ